MDTWSKKLLTVVTEKNIEDEIIAQLKAWGVKGYTISDVRGEGHRGVRRGDWDQSANIKLEIVADEKTVRDVCGKLKELYYDNYAMILYISDVLTLRDSKF